MRSFKEFVTMLVNGGEDENFTLAEKVVYGVIIPILLVVIMGVAGWLDTVLF